MHDRKSILKNIETIYESDNSLKILKDFERVLDEMNLYVYEHWMQGELISGPHDSRYWVTCSFMWPEGSKPNADGVKTLLDYGCHVKFDQDVMMEVRRIRTPDDIRPGTKKGKIDQKPIWTVEIKMPKKLMFNINQGYEKLPNIKNAVPAIKNRIADQTEQQVQAMAQWPNEF